MTLAVPPLRCADASGAPVELPFADGCYMVPEHQQLTLLDSHVELHGPIVFGSESMLVAAHPDPRATLLHDGPAVIRRVYLGPPEERGANELAGVVWEVGVGGGRGECALGLVCVVPG